MENTNSRSIIYAGAVLGTILIGLGLWYTGIMTFREGSFVPEFSLDALTSSNPPSLDRELVYPDTLPEEVRQIVAQNIATLKGIIEGNPAAVSAWLDLAIQYKTIEDYDGAIQIWKYLAAKYPSDTAVLYNLGNTYHFFLKDYRNSERYYKKAIARSPLLAMNYVGLHELYRYSYKQDTTAAADILMTALEQVKGDERIDIYLQLGSYYKEKGDTTNAIAYYTQARDVAVKLGNVVLIKQIDTELLTLK